MNGILTQIKKILQKSYPQHFIVRKPFFGTLIFSFMLFLFLILYKPLNVRESRDFGFMVTMLLYQIISLVPIFFFALALNLTNCFSKKGKWTFSKEIMAALLILLVAGISIYFAGFIMEEPSDRWNIPTFFDAVYRVVLVGFIPVLFFTLINIRHLYVNEIVKEFMPENRIIGKQENEVEINIISQLKKEELRFYPSQFLYAESEGNYVVFNLEKSAGIKKVVIRNSVSNIEQQLSDIPFFVRTHRAFIVNVKKVSAKKGNSLGYRLKFNGSDKEIPVSRQNSKIFDELIRQFR